jgi:hypothetical protein
MIQMTEQEIRRFWRHIYVQDKDKCWPWISWSGSHTRIGSVAVNGKLMAGNRLAYELTVGPIPHGFDLVHTCETSVCCNPYHHIPVNPGKKKSKSKIKSSKEMRRLL